MARLLHSVVSRVVLVGAVGLLSGGAVQAADRLEFPVKHGMINVVNLGARPNDPVSDQVPIETALGTGGNFPNPRMIYFPAGTYLLDDTLKMFGYTSEVGGCCATFQGQGPGHTVLKLIDNAPGYGNASAPKPLIGTSFGVNNGMAFRFFLFDLTVEIGTGNPGAVAVDFITNNQGAIDNVEIVARGEALSGLEMTRSWPGPCLIKNLTVRGFTYGIRIAQGQYGITFENITLEGQKTNGLYNQGNYISIHNLTSVNTVPAIRGGSTLLVKGDLRTPAGQSSTSPAVSIPAGQWFYGRDVTTAGYGATVDFNGARTTQNPLVEYATTTAMHSLFGDPWGSLKLPIKDAPEFHDNDTSKWVCTADHLDYFSPSIQKAITFAAANGKTTVYAPHQGQNVYPIYNGPVTVPPQIRNLVGFNCQVAPTAQGRTHIDVTGTTTDPLIIEGWNFSGVTLHHQSNRPVVIKHCTVDSITNSPGAGDLFIEDMDCKLHMINPQNIWIRQYNPEDQENLSPNFRVLNNGGNLWILGLKTEGSGNIITTRNGGSTELLGNEIYPNKGDNLGIPAFISEDACMSLMFVQLSYGATYQNLVRETRDGVTKTFTSAQLGGWMEPLYCGRQGCSGSYIDDRAALPQVQAPPCRRWERRVIEPRGPGSRPGVTVQTLYDLRGRRLGPAGVPVAAANGRTAPGVYVVGTIVK